MTMEDPWLPGDRERVGKRPQQWNLEKPVRGERRESERDGVLHARTGCDPPADAPCRRSEPRERANTHSTDQVAKPVADVAAWLTSSFIGGLVRGGIFVCPIVCLRRRELLREADRCPPAPRCNREQDCRHRRERQPESRRRHRPWIGKQNKPQRPREHE